MVAEAKTEYKAAPKRRSGARPKPSDRRGKQDFDFTKLASFGMWADRPETDEELLHLLGSGWGHPEGQGEPDHE